MMENEGTIRIKITGQQRETQKCCNGAAVVWSAGRSADCRADRPGWEAGYFSFYKLGNLEFAQLCSPCTYIGELEKMRWIAVDRSPGATI